MEDDLPIGVVATSGDGAVFSMNARLASSLGVTQDDARGRSFFSFVQENERANVRAAWAGAGSSGEPTNVVTRLACADGRVSTVRIDLRRSAERVVASVIDLGVTQDPSALHHEILATASHELRTPLSAILGWTSLLRAADPVDPASVAKGLEVIDRNARAQLRIVEDILDLASLLHGDIHLTFEDVDLAAVAREVVETVSPQAADKKVTVRVTAKAQPCRISADPDRMRQLLLNLLANALKFTPAGGLVEVTIGRHGSTVELLVRDTGRGMPPGFLADAFEPFRRADWRAAGGGIGLGLAIVRQIVLAHAGSVRADSEGLGKGTTVCVTMPTVSPVSRADATGRFPPLREVPMPRARCLRGVRVLVVEDDVDGRDLVELTLSREGADVRCAGTADAALEVIEAATFDVVLSDIGLPERDGYWLAREILRIRPQQRLVALTAFGRPADVARALDAGFVAHLTKPVEPADLVDTVSRLGPRA